MVVKGFRVGGAGVSWVVDGLRVGAIGVSWVVDGFLVGGVGVLWVVEGFSGLWGWCIVGGVGKLICYTTP